MNSFTNRMALSLASLSKNIDKFIANNKNTGMFTTKIRVLFLL